MYLVHITSNFLEKFPQRWKVCSERGEFKRDQDVTIRKNSVKISKFLWQTNRRGIVFDSFFTSVP